MAHKPFSQACENNKDPILQIISTVFSQPTTVWEIGSGTGQHACYFARHLPHVEWQPTDRSENIPGICLWQEEAQLANLKPPLTLDVTDAVWPYNSPPGCACDTPAIDLREISPHLEEVPIFGNESAGNPF